MQRYTGRVSRFDAERGFGFLITADNQRHFFHVLSCEGFVPQINMIVEFQIGPGRRGPAATCIRLLDDSLVAPPVVDAVQMLLEAIKNEGGLR